LAGAFAPCFTAAFATSAAAFATSTAAFATAASLFAACAASFAASFAAFFAFFGTFASLLVQLLFLHRVGSIKHVSFIPVSEGGCFEVCDVPGIASPLFLRSTFATPTPILLLLLLFTRPAAMANAVWIAAPVLILVN
jgi:hypothetical protein